MIHPALVLPVLLPRAAVAVAFVHLGGASLASASPERHIPRGELSPQVIEKVYDSPRGEVQFTLIERSGTAAADIESGSHGGYLRNVKGHLMGFTEVRGGGDCEAWFSSAKADALPHGCEFLFYDETDGRYMSVRSDEMEESDIFAMASGEIQALARGTQ